MVLIDKILKWLCVSLSVGILGVTLFGLVSYLWIGTGVSHFEFVNSLFDYDVDICERTGLLLRQYDCYLRGDPADLTPDALQHNVFWTATFDYVWKTGITMSIVLAVAVTLWQIVLVKTKSR